MIMTSPELAMKSMCLMLDTALLTRLQVGRHGSIATNNVVAVESSWQEPSWRMPGLVD
jgi:hypothetical protein